MILLSFTPVSILDKKITRPRALIYHALTAHPAQNPNWLTFQQIGKLHNVQQKLHTTPSVNQLWHTDVRTDSITESYHSTTQKVLLSHAIRLNSNLINLVLQYLISSV